MQPSAGSGENVNIHGRQLSRRLAESITLLCDVATLTRDLGRSLTAQMRAGLKSRK
jgi:hypothetical protein